MMQLGPQHQTSSATKGHQAAAALASSASYCCCCHYGCAGHCRLQAPQDCWLLVLLLLQVAVCWQLAIQPALHCWLLLHAAQLPQQLAQLPLLLGAVQRQFLVAVLATTVHNPLALPWQRLGPAPLVLLAGGTTI